MTPHVRVFRFGVVFSLALVLVGLRITGVQRQSLTYDEGAHAYYGIRVLNGHPEKPTSLYSARMPVSVFNVLPAALWKHTRFSETRNERFDSRFTVSALKTGRYATVLFSLLLGLVVFRWARELYGDAAGFFSLFLYAFCPNLIAHSQVVTTDLFVTGAITMALYYFWKFMERGGGGRAALSAATLGVAQLTKYTSVYLYPIYLLILSLALFNLWSIPKWFHG